MRALILDLDGTLVDTVYGHVQAWQASFDEFEIAVDAYLIHQRIGMGGHLLAKTLVQASGRHLNGEELDRLEARHSELVKKFNPAPRPLPGAVELLAKLRERKVRHGIATAGKASEIQAALASLDVTKDTVVVMHQDVDQPKPEPDPLLVCAKRLKVEPHECHVAGDAVWDLLAARRAQMQGIGLLTGGTGEAELYRAGAYRVYRDAGELLERLDELGLVE